MNQTGVYLYGFIPHSRSLDLSEIEGIEGNGPVRALGLGKLTAIVGEVAIDAFEAAFSSGVDGGPDPSWVLPRALRHEAILDAVLSRSPVLPARFGTLFSSSEALEEMASEHQTAISRFFEDLGDRLEWSLRGYHDPDRSVDLLLASDPLFSARQKGLPGTPGTRYFLEKKLRDDAKKAARQAALRSADAVRQALGAISDAVRSLPLRGLEAPGREMVLHETFLMSPETAHHALAILRDATADEVAGLLTLEPSGPWPPFHFCPELTGASP